MVFHARRCIFTVASNAFLNQVTEHIDTCGERKEFDLEIEPRATIIEGGLDVLRSIAKITLVGIAADDVKALLCESCSDGVVRH